MGGRVLLVESQNWKIILSGQNAQVCSGLCRASFQQLVLQFKGGKKFQSLLPVLTEISLSFLHLPLKQQKMGCLRAPPIGVTASACAEALCNGTPANGDAL